MIRSIITNVLVGLAMVAMIMPAQGQMVSTGDALALNAGNLETRVEAYLLRDGVAAELASLGVSHEMAMARVSNMSAAELQEISGRIDEMPAAGSGVIVILGVVFLVLIILEVVGVTNVFRR